MDSLTQPDFVVHQVMGKLLLQLEIVYQSVSFVDREAKLCGQVYDALLQKYRKHFRNDFESKFLLQEKGFTKDEKQFVMSVMSNLIGGIWYFYVSFKVQSIHNK